MNVVVCICGKGNIWETVLQKKNFVLKLNVHIRIKISVFLKNLNKNVLNAAFASYCHYLFVDLKCR